MFRFVRVLLCISLFGVLPGRADHVIVTGGPALRQWENLRVQQDQHDRWWANFVRAATLRMDEIRQVTPPGQPARVFDCARPDALWVVAILHWLLCGVGLVLALKK